LKVIDACSPVHTLFRDAFMPNRNNKASARSCFEDIRNASDLDVVDRIFSLDVMFHYPLGELNGLDAVRQYIGAVRTAFPDIRFTMEDLFAEEDRVACRWTPRGTQTGEFPDKRPSGKQVEVPGNTIFRFSQGRIEEIWIAFNPNLLI